MKNMRKLVMAALLAMVVAAKGYSVDVAIDRNHTHQTIDGFGFFGPMLYWWSSANPLAFWNQAWLDLVIDSLGITIWRNEYYSEESNQDANWAKQKPFLQALKAKADASGVPMKYFYSVWSPPSSMKCACSSSG
jgi:O-glycosyl hydrolase